MTRSRSCVWSYARMLVTSLVPLLLAHASPAQQLTRSGDYQVYSWTANDKLAREVISFAQQIPTLPGMPRSAPAFGQPIRIYLAPNANTFARLTSGNAPEWGAGVAMPEAGIIVLRAYGGTHGAY